MADQEPPDDQLPGQLPLPGMPEPDSIIADDPVVEAARQTLMAELDRIRKSNRNKFEALLRQGGRPDPDGINMLRFNILLTMLLSADEQLDFDLTFEHEMTTVLNECLTQLRQANVREQLLPTARHVPPGNGLIIPTR